MGSIYFFTNCDGSGELGISASRVGTGKSCLCPTLRTHFSVNSYCDEDRRLACFCCERNSRKQFSSRIQLHVHALRPVT
jgi:hypothetical protein